MAIPISVYCQGMSVPELLRRARHEAGLSQKGLAERAKTSQPAVARYEAGTAAPSIATLERLLAACGTDLVVEARERHAPRSRRSHSNRLAAVRSARGALTAAARRHGVRDLRVFGSTARGEDSADSDIDLLVELDRGRTLLDLIGFKQDAETILGVRVDVVAPRFLKEPIRRRALAGALPV